MFWNRRKKPEARSYDPERQRPVIRCSICTGEEVAGFRDLDTGKFHEDRLIAAPQDLQDFLDQYGIREMPPKEY